MAGTYTVTTAFTWTGVYQGTPVTVTFPAGTITPTTEQQWILDNYGVPEGFATNPAGQTGSTAPASAASTAVLTAAGWDGTWSSSSSYTLGALVTYNGTTYISLLAGNLGNNPSTATSAWQVFAQGAASALTNNLGGQEAVQTGLAATTAASTVTCNPTSGSEFQITVGQAGDSSALAATLAITVSALTAGVKSAFTVALTNGNGQANTLALPNGSGTTSSPKFVMPSGLSTTVQLTSTSGGRDLLQFFTDDGGAHFYVTACPVQGAYIDLAEPADVDVANPNRLADQLFGLAAALSQAGLAQQAPGSDLMVVTGNPADLILDVRAADLLLKNPKLGSVSVADGTTIPASTALTAYCRTIASGATFAVAGSSEAFTIKLPSAGHSLPGGPATTPAGVPGLPYLAQSGTPNGGLIFTPAATITTGAICIVFCFSPILPGSPPQVAEAQLLGIAGSHTAQLLGKAGNYQHTNAAWFYWADGNFTDYNTATGQVLTSDAAGQVTLGTVMAVSYTIGTPSSVKIYGAGVGGINTYLTGPIGVFGSTNPAQAPTVSSVAVGAAASQSNTVNWAGQAVYNPTAQMTDAQVIAAMKRLAFYTLGATV